MSRKRLFVSIEILGITYLHLAINSITTTESSLRGRSRNVVASVRASLPVGTISSHMTSISTNATDDIGCEVALLGAVVFSMSDLAT